METPKPHAELEALRNGTLEIEGYERVRWTKFDPDNPKTFPPIGGFLYLKSYSGSVAYNVGYHALGDTDEHFAYMFWEWGMTHWRPLPPPPGKEEGK